MLCELTLEKIRFETPSNDVYARAFVLVDADGDMLADEYFTSRWHAEDYAEETEMTGYAVDTVWLTMSVREAEEQGYEWEEG